MYVVQVEMAKWWDFGVFEPRTLVQGCTLYMYRPEWTLDVYMSELFNSYYFPPVTICFRGGGTGCDGVLSGNICKGSGRYLMEIHFM